jgi:hypothetical protein
MREIDEMDLARRVARARVKCLLDVDKLLERNVLW